MPGRRCRDLSGLGRGDGDLCAIAAALRGSHQSSITAENLRTRITGETRGRRRKKRRGEVCVCCLFLCLFVIGHRMYARLICLKYFYMMIGSLHLSKPLD